MMRMIYRALERVAQYMSEDEYKSWLEAATEQTGHEPEMYDPNLVPGHIYHDVVLVEGWLLANTKLKEQGHD